MYPSSGIKLYVTFEGIRRTYMVNHVNIPENTDYRCMPYIKFWSGGGIKSKPVSKLEIRILRNGRSYYSVMSEAEGWNLDFSRNRNNRFAIREGVGHRYMVQIIHEKTGQPITELTKLTDFNFHEKITENNDQKRWQLIFPGTISMEFVPVE